MNSWQEQRNSQPQRTRNSAIVIFALIVLVAAACIATSAFAMAGSGLMVRIEDAGGNVRSLPLDADATLEVSCDGGNNTVLIENDSVCVIEATCPNQDCVHQGNISSAGQQIVCLPHKLVISIVAAENNELAGPTEQTGRDDQANSADQAYDVIGS